MNTVTASGGGEVKLTVAHRKTIVSVPIVLAEICHGLHTKIVSKKLCLASDNLHQIKLYMYVKFQIITSHAYM